MVMLILLATHSQFIGIAKHIGIAREFKWSSEDIAEFNECKQDHLIPIFMGSLLSKMLTNQKYSRMGE